MEPVYKIKRSIEFFYKRDDQPKHFPWIDHDGDMWMNPELFLTVNASDWNDVDLIAVSEKETKRFHTYTKLRRL